MLGLPTGLVLSMMERFGKIQYLRKRAIKQYWPVYCMADEFGEAVEFAYFSPQYFKMTPTTVDGYIEEMEYPNSSSSYGLFSRQLLRTGEIDVKLSPSTKFKAITKVEIRQDTVVIRQKGLGGMPQYIQITAESSKHYTRTPLNGGGAEFLMEFPLYNRVLIGLDDTDSAVKGATFETTSEIAAMLETALKPKVRFMRMLMVLNWPPCPHKTTNNASALCVFAARPEKVDELVSWFTKLAKKFSISKDTGMAVMNRIIIPEELTAYSRDVKTRLVEIEEAYKVAEKVGAKIISISSERKEPQGVIGALAALGWTDRTVEGLSPVLRQ